MKTSKSKGKSSAASGRSAATRSKSVPVAAEPKVRSTVKAAAKPTGPSKKEKVAGAVASPAPAATPAQEFKLDSDYRPSDSEPFMNGKQRAYFRAKLLKWKEDINRQTRETLEGLHEDSTQHADLADRATSETDRALELRARDRQRKLVAKIDAALARLEDGTYGYCEETGEPIGLKRLDARPIATLSLEAQERHERRERVYRED